MSQMSQFYYNTIRDRRALARASDAKSRLAPSGWKPAVSKWGRNELLAHRVLCNVPVDSLPLFANFRRDPSTSHGCIAELLEGPESIDDLAAKSEPQIVQDHEPDSLGYVWAALAPFVRASKTDASITDGPSTPKKTRERKAPERYGDVVPSDQADLGSSPPEPHKKRPTTSDSDSSLSSAGYMVGLEAPLLEDATIRLASCFIRCVLNYAQPPSSPNPFLEFRDERLNYSYKLTETETIHAVDDGGIHFLSEDTASYNQVALLEGKRTFQKIVNGKAVITDELLAQMVGEALALALQVREELRTDFITILAATHYLRFFHFHVSESYVEAYMNADLSGVVLQVYSTDWLDIKESKHRGNIASHLLSLIAWTHHNLT